MPATSPKPITAAAAWLEIVAARFRLLSSRLQLEHVRPRSQSLTTVEAAPRVFLWRGRELSNQRVPRQSLSSGGDFDVLLVLPLDLPARCQRFGQRASFTLSSD